MNQGPLVMLSFTPWTDETRPNRWGGSAKMRMAAYRSRIAQEKAEQPREDGPRKEGAHR